jgi:hypothetical protein
VDSLGGWTGELVILDGMVPDLSVVADAHGGVFNRDEARAAGYTDGEIRARVSAGQWLRLRRGLYVEAVRFAALDAVAKQRLSCRAALRALDVAAVISHQSAADLIGLATHPASRARLADTVELTTLESGTARRHPGVFAHRIPMDIDEWVDRDGLPRTTGARTVIDVAASRPFVESVVVGDSALRSLVATRVEMVELAGRRPRRGAGRMLRVAAFANGLSETVGESVSRVGLASQGVPPPTLQLVVGDFRSDFGWPELRTLGEFDGRLKYTDPAVLWAEKLREDYLRDLGWELVRWTWQQITTAPQMVAQRLFRAFARSARRAG